MQGFLVPFASLFATFSAATVGKSDNGSSGWSLAAVGVESNRPLLTIKARGVAVGCERLRIVASWRFSSELRLRAVATGCARSAPLMLHTQAALGLGGEVAR
jgi:hypothetical protein